MFTNEAGSEDVINEGGRRRMGLLPIPSEPGFHLPYDGQSPQPLCPHCSGTLGAAHLHLVQLAFLLTVLACELPLAADILFLQGS